VCLGADPDAIESNPLFARIRGALHTPRPQHMDDGGADRRDSGTPELARPVAERLVRLSASRVPRGCGVTLRARWVTLRACWVTLRGSLGDAESSLGDAESSLGDAESSLGDAESLLGDAKSSLGDAKRLRHEPCINTALKGRWSSDAKVANR
jgi:hypothetical protein